MLGALGLTRVMAAFVGTPIGRLRLTDRVYLVLDGIDAGILARYSAHVGIWIFLVLEGAWIAVSWWSCSRGPARIPSPR